MNYIYKLTLTLFLYCLSLSAQACLPNGITFSTQGQIDSFAINYPGCADILGNVEIEGVTPNEITNLNGLIQIASIRGHLRIDNNDMLTSLNGLNSLASVAEYVAIVSNQDLPDLYGLDNLYFIGEYLIIYANPSLTNVDGLSSLNNIAGDLLVSNNAVLISLVGLENLNAIGGSLRAINNASFVSLAGLVNVTTIGGDLDVYGNHAMTSLTGLISVNEIGGNVTIQYNNALESLSGLNNLLTVGGDFEIIGSDFNNLPGSGALVSVTDVDSLVAIGGELRIVDNLGLNSLAGMDYIDYTTITNLDIYGNAELSLCSVTSICNYVDAGGSSFLSNNVMGCNTVNEILSTCTFYTNLSDVTANVSIFPNPTKGIFEIQGIPNGVYHIFNTAGQVLQSGQVTNSPIDISKLPKGLYFLSIETNHKTTTKRLVKI